MIIFPILTLVAICALTRFITKSWISPGTFFSLCWLFFVMVPIIFAPQYKVDHFALWFICIFTMSVSAGSIIAFPRENFQSKTPIIYKTYSNFKFLYYALIFFIIVSFVGLYLLTRFASDLYYSSNYINNWMMIPNMIAVDRYSGILNYPFIIKYSLYFIYPGILLGGLLFGYKDDLITIKLKFFSLIPVFQAIVLGIIEGARTSILLGLVLFVSSWLSTFMFNEKQKTNKKRSFFKFIFSVGSFLSIFTIFFVFIQWLRQGMDTIIFELLIDRVQAYFFGYLSAFSQWISGNFEINTNSGFITFAGPFNLVGIMDRPLGFYEPINITNNISTNIFTAFRGIVTDFTIPGAIIIGFLIGFINQIIFQNNEKSTLISSVPISLFYAFTLYSPLISIFHYNSILFSWIILLIILILAKNETVDSYS